MFLDKQEPKVFYKNDSFDQIDCQNVVSDCLNKWLYLASDYFDRNIAKKSQKQQIINIH